MPKLVKLRESTLVLAINLSSVLFVFSGACAVGVHLGVKAGVLNQRSELVATFLLLGATLGVVALGTCTQMLRNARVKGETP